MSNPSNNFNLTEFSANFVSAVNQVMYPADKAKTNKPELVALSVPLKAIFGRYKIELYFLFAEEHIFFENQLSEDNFKELLRRLISDLKAEKYDSEVLSWFCIIISYYASIANRRNIDTARYLAARAIYDAITNYEKDGINDDIVKGIKNSLTEMAQRSVNKKISDSEKK